ncbi:MAG: M48 family metallopeptidase [Prevotellaceae bacterium]|jgi:predicted metal-dependent hydrolase|nr:M48 family metallopeptidase [Prevotellaceae bacterium]
MNERMQIIVYPSIGEVYFRKMALSRSIKISLRNGRSVLVTLPLNTSFETAELFLHDKIEWVIQAMDRLKAAGEARQTRFTPDTDFNTCARKVRLLPDVRQNVRVQLTDDTVFIYYPVHLPVDDRRLQLAIRKAVEHAWKVEAHEILPARIARLSAQSGLPFTQLLIKRTVSYWGLCAPDNSITLNIHLMHLPVHLIDYVILHELCHTRHKNHGPSFWELLNSLTGGHAREYAKEMKKYSTREY